MEKLTKGERDLLFAIRHRLARSFHKSAVERCERKGLVRWTNGMRLVGCNSFSANRFDFTQAGFEAAMDMAA